MNEPLRFRREAFPSGFTLIELLVVLGVIALFVGAFSTALRPGSPTVAVEGAQAQMASLLTQARGVALTKEAPARLIIHNDLESNPQRYLRFAGIVYLADENGNGEEDEGERWLAATDGLTLPGSVFAYVDELANMVVEPEFTIAYLSNEPEDYAYIEFAPNGTVKDVEERSPVLALSSAELEIGTDGTFEGVLRDEDNARGALIRRYGSFVLVNSSEALNALQQ